MLEYLTLACVLAAGAGLGAVFVLLFLMGGDDDD
jgi:hypothetical protein